MGGGGVEEGGAHHGGGESEEAEKEGMQVCHYNWAHIFSLANKMDMPQYLATQSNLNLIVGFLIMIILMFFRRSQRELDAEVDAANITPGDYTIVVKNIPKELGGEKEYKEVLSKLFVNRASYPLVLNRTKEEKGSGNRDFPDEIKIASINLVYNIDEVIELEEKIAEKIKHKQAHLTRMGRIDHNDEELKKIDEEIESLEAKVHHIEKETPEVPEKFTGIAFISFEAEQNKDDILE